MKHALILCLMLLAGPAFAGEASFDCGKAATAPEKAICDDANPGLGSRDIALAKLFADLKELGEHDAILAGQSAWLKTRDACGADAACLQRAYDARLLELARAGGDEAGVTGSYAFDNRADESSGEAFVVRNADGTLAGEVRSLSGPQNYGCEAIFAGAIAFGDAWLWTDLDTEPDDEGNRCQILLRGDGKTLRFDSRYCSLYCGVHAGFDETYTRAR